MIDACIEGSFWIKARKDLFIWAIKKHFLGAQRFFEIGCATGMMVAFIRQAFPGLSITGCEVFSGGLSYIPKRIPDATIFQAYARSVPFENEFDVIGAFDVIEHITEDQQVLDQMFQAVTPGGGIVVSVPHHPFMWSQRDEALRHKRRYTRKELVRKTANAGFKILRTTAFVSTLFPAMVVESRLKRRRKEGYDALEALQPWGVVNSRPPSWNGSRCLDRRICGDGGSTPCAPTL